MSTLHVSGTRDSSGFTVARVHPKTSPDGSVRVLHYPERGRRKPRAGDVLVYRAPDGIPPYVEAPRCARRGAVPRGRGLRVYLASDVATAACGLADAEGISPAALVSRLVRERAALVPALEKPL